MPVAAGAKIMSACPCLLCTGNHWNVQGRMEMASPPMAKRLWAEARDLLQLTAFDQRALWHTPVRSGPSRLRDRTLRPWFLTASPETSNHETPK